MFNIIARHEHRNALAYVSWWKSGWVAVTILSGSILAVRVNIFSSTNLIFYGRLREAQAKFFKGFIIATTNTFTLPIFAIDGASVVSRAAPMTDRCLYHSSYVSWAPWGPDPDRVEPARPPPQNTTDPASRGCFGVWLDVRIRGGKEGTVQHRQKG